MSDDARSAEKPTDQWVTGDEPMTGPQASYLETLAREAGEEVPEGLTKAQASELIDRLQDVTGRGASGGDQQGSGGGGASES
jgi:hypothetical protein